MTKPQVQQPSMEDVARMAAEWQELAEQSQRVVSAFVEKQSTDDGYSIVDPQSISKSFMEMTAKLLSDPRKLMAANLGLWQDSMRLWQSSLQRALGGEGGGGCRPESIGSPLQG